jgi:mono/diheme cytochrome c family protein
MTMKVFASSGPLTRLEKPTEVIMQTLLTCVMVGLLAFSGCKKHDELSPQKPDMALIERGRYLSTLMLCDQCHTPLGPNGPVMDKAFAGGREETESLGTWRSPNITPDKKTGIGNWTDAQLIVAIREGKRPDGSQMYVAMPYPSFNRLSDDDAKALVAFLRSLPPIENAVAPKPALGFSKVPVPPAKGLAVPTTDPVRYGEYLIALMQCALCHTPTKGDSFEPDTARVWAGGFPFKIPKPYEPLMGSGTLYGANLTSDAETGIGKYSEDDIYNALMIGKRPNGAPVRGPMKLFSLTVFPKLTSSDMKAAIAFIKHIPPIKNKVPEANFTPPGGAPEPSPEVDRGRYLADLMVCSQCHTPLGPNGPVMDKAFAGGLEVSEAFGTWRSPNITPDKKTGIGTWTDEQLIVGIREGKRPDGSQMYAVMPYMSYNRLSDDDAKALVAFLRSLPPIENAVAPNTDLQLPKVPSPPAPGLAVSTADPVKYGEYLTSLMRCALCHTPTKEGTFEPDMSKMWAGGFLVEIPKAFEPIMGPGPLYGSNITSDAETGIGKYSEDDIYNALMIGKRPDGTPVRGPMKMFSLTVFPKLTSSDMKAIIAFIKHIPPIKNKVPEAHVTPQ